MTLETLWKIAVIAGILYIIWSNRTMNQKISDALDALSAAVDEDLEQLRTITEELRAAQTLSDDESTAIAERISAITDRLKGTADTAVQAVGGAGESGDQQEQQEEQQQE